MNGNVVNSQVALRERIAHQMHIDILLDLLEPVLMAQRVDEGDIRPIQPDLGGESGVCAINRFRIFLDQVPDSSAVGGWLCRRKVSTGPASFSYCSCGACQP